MPTKCVSKPDENEVKAAIKKVFDLTVPEVLIERGYKVDRSYVTTPYKPLWANHGKLIQKFFKI